MSGLDPIETFRQEAQELSGAGRARPARPGASSRDRDLIDAVFRGLHTLKGSGAMFGFDALAAFTHHCETAFDRVRKGEVPASPRLVACVLAAQDHMRALAEGRPVEPGADEALLADLHAAVEGRGRLKSRPHHPIRPRASGRSASACPPTPSSMAPRPLPLLDELRELGDCRVRVITDDVPMLEDLVPTECRLAWEVLLTTPHGRDAIDDVFIFVIDEMTLEVEEVTASADIETASSEEKSAVTVQAEKPAETGAQDTRAAKTGGETVRVPAERLDEMMDRVGELVIAQSRLDAAGVLQPRHRPARRRRGDRAPGRRDARHDDGRAHGAGDPAVRPLPSPDPRSAA